MHADEPNGDEAVGPRSGSEKVADQQSCSTVTFGARRDAGGVPPRVESAPAGVDDGRRVYIHAISLDDLALRDDVAATVIYSALAGLPVIKLTHHDLVEDAVGLREFDPDKADRLERAVIERWMPPITRLLQCVGVRAGHESPHTPLLGREERVFATCLDSNYYTFATTDNAARRMYEDVLELREVWAMVREGRDTYRDLTMIRGRRLVLLNQAAAPLAFPPLRSFDSKQRAAACEHVEAAKRATLRDLELELRRIVKLTVPTPTAAETQRLCDFELRCIAAVRRTILHLSQG
jgi:hypothetical protein